jgi:DNA-binding response OmpR family regulator
VNHAEQERIIVGPLEIRPDRYLVLLGERTLPLSERELTLLTVLARRAGEVVSRAELYELAWGRPLARTDRSVDVYVHKLRRKLEAAVPDVRFIHTHHTIGYRLDPQPTPLDGPRRATERFRSEDPASDDPSWRMAAALPRP